MFVNRIFAVTVTALAVLPVAIAAPKPCPHIVPLCPQDQVHCGECNTQCVSLDTKDCSKGHAVGLTLASSVIDQDSTNATIYRFPAPVRSQPPCVPMTKNSAASAWTNAVPSGGAARPSFRFAMPINISVGVAILNAATIRTATALDMTTQASVCDRQSPLHSGRETWSRLL